MENVTANRKTEQMREAWDALEIIFVGIILHGGRFWRRKSGRPGDRPEYA
jgi:hypothetical protein